MAIQKQRREDLLQDATQYHRRGLWRVPRSLLSGLTSALGEEDRLTSPSEETIEVFVGIRSQAGWSIYFGEDPVLQFDASNCLRRLYWDGQKFAASGRHLERLKRGRLGGKVEHDRQRLEPREEQRLLANCKNALAELLSAQESGRLELIGQRPGGEPGLPEEIWRRVRAAARGFAIAETPNA